MRDASFEFLRASGEHPQPYGHETRGQRGWADYAPACADRKSSDAHDNRVALLNKKSSPARIMLAAYFGEIRRSTGRNGGCPVPLLRLASAQRIGDLRWPLIHEHQPQVVVVDCSAIPDLQYTALKMLTEAERSLREFGIRLWLAALNPEPLHLIQNTSLGKTLGRERMYFNLEQAVRSFQKQSGAAKQSRAAGDRATDRSFGGSP